MSQETVEIVRRVFETFNREGPEAALTALSPNVEWHDLPELPDAELHYGHAGFLKSINQFFGALEDSTVNVDELIDFDEDVVVCARVVGRGRGSKARFEQRNFAVWTVRNGLVVRSVWFRTREEALEAVEASEESGHIES
jgi:ketosteroid isomerase-like protein